MELQGMVCARVVSCRFALSGKIASVNKFVGDKVAKGNLIASLDRKILQAELDKELADFEKVRADFEIFAGKNTDPIDAETKYLKTEKQASLNASVKNVELAKANLDQCDLFSPVDGIIEDDSSIIPGLFVTPSGSEIKIVDTNSFYVEIEIQQKDIKDFKGSKDAKIKIESIDDDLSGKTLPVYSDGKKFFVRIPISSQDLLVGMSSSVQL